ncbi:FkbM family methyltransferase [Hoeflea sp.]|uniref:FkbM family methyltransferase n=1 Tax=Hoeflea sp. TaxID=1940281 RepID=UPI003B527C04
MSGNPTKRLRGVIMTGSEWKPLDSERWKRRNGVNSDRAIRRPNPLQRGLIALARGSILRRGVFRATVSRLVFLLGGNRPFDVDFRGVTYRLEGGRNLIEYGILLNPEYNAQDIDFLAAGLSDGGVIVDIGSNIGLYSLPLARAAGREGRCIAIDANPLMTERLMRNAALSGLDNVTAIASAVSDRDGSGQLTVRKNDDAIVAVDESADGPIAIRTLAALLDEAGVPRVDVLKIDIEGHEDKALPTYLDTALPEMMPRRIVIEHPEADTDYPGCAAAFARHRYRLTGRTRNNSLYRRDDA